MRRIEAVVVGGGQSGLAMSRCLTDVGVEHVVLERGEVGERWRRASWDSLRLLTPRWQARLPGWTYDGSDPDGYMHWRETVGYLEGFARSFAAPLVTGVSVTSVRQHAGRFIVDSTGGAWLTDHVVVATGDCQETRRPAFASRLSSALVQIDPTRYRNPGDLPEGGVLVVGSSATGVQLAHELHASGRPVTMAVGRHTRLPRTYRGRDILWWLDRMGILDERADQVPDLIASREQPSLQLVGTPDRRDLGLTQLARAGVRLVGRALDGRERTVRVEEDLIETTVAADVKLAKLLERVERFIAERGLGGGLPSPDPFEPTLFPSSPDRIELAAEGIRSVLWATGYRRDYGWLHLPVLDASGEIIHAGGVTPVPGLYVLGLRFLRRRKSSFIDGAADDARDLTTHIVTRRMAKRADRAVA
jgi:putative flavoprotein involved in K+ transport